MGKLTKKILGNVGGAVGDITFSGWNGQTVIKAKSEGSKAAPTTAQLFVREKFKVMSPQSVWMERQKVSLTTIFLES